MHRHYELTLRRDGRSTDVAPFVGAFDLDATGSDALTQDRRLHRIIVDTIKADRGDPARDLHRYELEWRIPGESKVVRVFRSTHTWAEIQQW